MPPVSQPWADFLFNLSNVVLVTGATAVLLGTIGTVWMGSIKEWYGDQRIKDNETRTAEANQIAGEANERAASAIERASTLEKEARLAEQRTAELNIQLEKIRSPRLIDLQNQMKIVEICSKFQDLIFDTAVIGNDPEASVLLDQIEQLLKLSRWKQQDWQGGDLVHTRSGKPNAGISVNIGVAIVYAQDEWEAFRQAANSLSDALNAAGIETRISIESWKSRAEGGIGPTKNTLHIFVGKKPT